MFEYGQNIQDRTQTQLHLLHSSIFVRSGSIFFTVSNSSSCISRGECSDSLAFRSSYWGTCFVGCTLCVNWTVYTCCDNNNLTCVWFVCLFVDVFGQVPTQHQSSFDSSSMRTSRSHQLFWWEDGDVKSEKGDEEDLPRERFFDFIFEAEEYFDEDSMDRLKNMKRK